MKRIFLVLFGLCLVLPEAWGCAPGEECNPLKEAEWKVNRLRGNPDLLKISPEQQAELDRLSVEISRAKRAAEHKVLAREHAAFEKRLVSHRALEKEYRRLYRENPAEAKKIERAYFESSDRLMGARLELNQQVTQFYRKRGGLSALKATDPGFAEVKNAARLLNWQAKILIGALAGLGAASMAEGAERPQIDSRKFPEKVNQPTNP